MTLDTSTFSPGAEAVYLVVSPSKGGYLRRQRWLLALLGGFLTQLRGVAETLTGLLHSTSNVHQFYQKVCQKVLFLTKSGIWGAFHLVFGRWRFGFNLPRISTVEGSVP
jgi:hypothetical protein